MPVIQTTIGGEGFDVSLLPVEFSLTIPAIGPTFTPPVLGAAAWDFGLDITFICPGFPACGKETDPCTDSIKTEVLSFNPLNLILTKIPGLPTIPTLFPGMTLRKQVPSSGFNPLKCPHYNKKAPV